MKILICCTNGSSSSALVRKLKTELQEANMDDSVTIDYSAFILVKNKLDQYDIIMCCSHLQYYVKHMIEEHIKDKVPVYIMPMKIYGSMSAMELLIDAKDVIESFSKKKMNPFHFDGEDNILHVKRTVAYRNYKGDKDEG